MRMDAKRTEQPTCQSCCRDEHVCRARLAGALRYRKNRRNRGEPNPMLARWLKAGDRQGSQ